MLPGSAKPTTARISATNKRTVSADNAHRGGQCPQIMRTELVCIRYTIGDRPVSGEWRSLKMRMGRVVSADNAHGAGL